MIATASTTKNLILRTAAILLMQDKSNCAKETVYKLYTKVKER
jgi:hypothetical protein